MKSNISSYWAKKIEEWIGEASFGCLENSYVPKYFQRRLPGLFRKRAQPQVRKASGHRTPAPPLKKAGLGLLLLAWALAPIHGWAQELAPNQKWIEQADAGFVVPSSANVASVFNVGLGGDILVGYRFDRNFSLATDLGYYQCDQKGGEGAWIYVPLMEVARYNFGTGQVRPFVLLGMGAVFNSYSQSLVNVGQNLNLSRQETNFLLSPGAGVLFVVYSDAAVYLQARMDMNFISNNKISSPAVDNPSVFIPVKAGLSFFVL
jgi:hypothetical protein